MRIALLNLACFALGAVIGVTLLSGRADEPRPVPESAPVRQPEPERPPAPPSPGEEPAESVKIPPVVRNDLAAVLAAIPVEVKAEKGTGTITGRVITGEGKPVSGILVRAVRDQDRVRRKWG
jgi:hypothetical protein